MEPRPDPPRSDTELICLNGWWAFQPLGGEEKPAEPPAHYTGSILVPSFWNTLPEGWAGTWGAYVNFHWPEPWNRARAAAFRREFSLPARTDNRRVRLRFDAVLAEAEVWVNGAHALSITDGFLPFESDVTNLVRWEDTNTVEVVVRDRPTKNGDLLRPGGSWVGWNLRGIWQDVTLELVAPVRITDLFVQTSVREKSLRVSATVTNQTQSPVPVRLLHEAENERFVLDTGIETVAAGEERTLHAFIPWGNARQWSPDDPHLYRLVTRFFTEDETGHAGNPVAVRRTRFGFREFWIDVTGFRLNGEPIRLLGDSWHYMGAVQQTPAYAREWMRMVRDTGANAVRLHAMPHPTFFLDVADEEGICVIDESAVYGSGGNLALGEEEFWEAARDHVRRLALRDRNHPSVCLWSASNEVVWKGGPDCFPGLLSLAEAIAAVDPTRPVSFDENCSDLGGGAAVFAGHYGSLPEWDRNWKRDRPLIVNEFSSLYYSGPEEPAKWGGEACFADFDARLRGAGEEAREMLVGLRAMGAASITPWNFVWYGHWAEFPKEEVLLEPEPESPGIKTQRIGPYSSTLNYEVASGRRLAPGAPPRTPNPAYEIMRDAYRRRAAFLRQRGCAAFAGELWTGSLDVFNDTLSRARLRVTVCLGGGVHDTGESRYEPAEHRTVRFTLPVPRVEDAGMASLTITVFDDGSPCQTTTVPFWIGIRKPVETPAAPDRMRIVSGTPETPVTLRDYVASLDADGFFREGGVLLDMGCEWLPDPESPLAPVRRDFLRAWRRTNDGFWNGVPPDEFLQCWGQDGGLPWPNGAVVSRVFRKPPGGGALPLAEVADGNEGLEFTPLLWLPRGRGGVILCGFNAGENSASEPAAQALQTALRLCSLHLAGKPTMPVVIGGAAARELCARTGVRESDGQSTEILLMDGPALSALDPDAAESLAQRIRSGCKMLLINTSEATLEPLRLLTGRSLGLVARESCNVAKHPANGGDSILAGISNDDLVWVRRGQNEAIFHRAFQPHPEMEPLIVTVPTRWAGYAEAAEQHKYAWMLREMRAFPGEGIVVGRLRVGKGEVVLCQLRLEEARLFTRKAERVFSALAGNLGAAFTAESSPLCTRVSAFSGWVGVNRQRRVVGV